MDAYILACIHVCEWMYACINAWMDGCMCMSAHVCILGSLSLNACMCLCIVCNDLLITALFSFSGALITHIAVDACMPNHSAHTLSLIMSNLNVYLGMEELPWLEATPTPVHVIVSFMAHHLPTVRSDQERQLIA